MIHPAVDTRIETRLFFRKVRICDTIITVPSTWMMSFSCYGQSDEKNGMMNVPHMVGL